MRAPQDLRDFAVGVAAGAVAAFSTTSARATDEPAASVGPARATRPMNAADAAAIDRLAQDALAKNPDLPGMWIGVWDPGKGVYVQAYGHAVKGGATATIADHGRIGSVTKTFTVVAVLEQVAAGKLTLESTIGEILPELAGKYPAIAGITVDELAGMRSGIPDYGNTGIVIKGVAADPARNWTADDLVDAAMTLPLSPAGTGGYSTTNTIILGQMLEKLTGQPIDWIVTDLARRAGLTQSALQAPDLTRMPAPASHGYVAAPGVKEMEAVGASIVAGTDVSKWTVSWGQAGGGMYSTITDLGTWAGTGLGTSLLPAGLAAMRLATQKIPGGDYGLGIQDWGAGWIGHTGQIIGWESVVAFNTRTGAAFVAVVNETGSIVSALSVGLEVFPDLHGLLGRQGP